MVVFSRRKLPCYRSFGSRCQFFGGDQEEDDSVITSVTEYSSFDTYHPIREFRLFNGTRRKWRPTDSSSNMKE